MAGNRAYFWGGPAFRASSSGSGRHRLQERRRMVGGDDAGRGGALEELADGALALVAHVHGEAVHVEVDVLARDVVLHLLRVGADVLARGVRVREGVLHGAADGV